jgi:DNA (cytosine-5)-methyltransferase 1
MKVIDLFCGAGGSTLGAKLAGHQVTDAYDWDRDALASYHLNHPEVRTHKQNILDLDAKDLPDADILMGSTPCESFSVANRTSRTNDMTLTDKFLELVHDYKPKYWIMENVPPVRRYLLDKLPPEQLRILLAARYGVPQLRYRLMAGNYPEPVRTHSNEPFDCLPPFITFKEIREFEPAIWDVLSITAIRGLFKRQQAMALHGLHFNARILGPDDVPFTFLASEYKGIRAGVVVIYEGGVLRRITFLEGMRMQSLPDDYKFVGTKEKRWKLVGQAVPSLMMRACLLGCGNGTRDQVPSAVPLTGSITVT